NGQVTTVDPTEFAEPQYESGNPLALNRRVGSTQESDGRQLALLLRARRERPGGDTGEQCDELAPPHHSITSSARASSVGGTSRPRALAVFRLRTSSIFTACSTGRSAGLVPRRTFPVKMPTRWYASARLLP